MATLRRKSGAGSPRLWIPRPFRILSLDPGGTTGWAYAEWVPKPNESLLLTDLDQINFYSGQIGPEEHHEKLDEEINCWAFGVDGPPLQLVCESFQFRQHINPDHAKTKVELISCEYIGIVKLFAAQNSLSLSMQTASTAKTFIPDKGPQANVKLKQLGVYKPVTHNVHAMDAMRHLLKHMVVTMRMRSPITDHWL